MINNIRDQFPIFNHHKEKELIYLDSASTTQKHESVLSEIDNYYKKYSANIHRSVYPIAEEATNKFEASREKVSNFINSPKYYNCFYVSLVNIYLRSCYFIFKFK